MEARGIVLLRQMLPDAVRKRCVFITRAPLALSLERACVMSVLPRFISPSLALTVLVVSCWQRTKGSGSDSSRSDSSASQNTSSFLPGVNAAHIMAENDAL
eukprot:2683372-Rhodomonas_salina.1